MKKAKIPKNSSFIIITSLLVSFSLIFTVIAAKTQTLIGTKAKEADPIKWVLYFGPFGTPKDSINTARKLLEVIKSYGIEVNCIDEWKAPNSGWSGHCLAFPPTLNNFPIVAGKGYSLEILPSKTPIVPSWNDIKNKYFEPLNQINVTLTSPLESISFTTGVLVKMKGMDSEQLCLTIEEKTNNIYDTIEVSRLKPNPYPYYESGEGSKWDTYTCGDINNKFNLKAGEGYFLVLERPSGTDPITITFP